MKMKKIKLAKNQDGTKQEYDDYKNDDCEDADEEENIDVGSASFQTEDDVAVKFEPSDDNTDQFNLHPFRRISYPNNRPVLPNDSFASPM